MIRTHLYILGDPGADTGGGGRESLNGGGGGKV